VDGRTLYPLTAEELAVWLERFVAENGMNLIGERCNANGSKRRREVQRGL
jgi:5-methyltetrahydrofolate--homocysteine methyltransferase